MAAACKNLNLVIAINLLSDSWEKNWVYSEHPGKEFGKFVLSAGQFFKDADNKGK